MIKSNEATIEQINEAIAVFEGRKQTQFNEGGKATRFWSDAKAINRFYSESLHYHESWDELMPVWTKFRQLMKPGSNDMFDEWVNSLGYYLLSSERPDRFCERLYYAIQWYNNQSTTNE